MEVFCRHIPQCTVHQRNFQGMFEIYPCLCVIILWNTNRCVCSTINEIPTTFGLMQMFELTFINKCMFLLQLYSSDLTKHEHMYTSPLTLFMMLLVPHRFLSMLNTGVTLITVLTHNKFSISLMFVSFTLIGGHLLYNSSMFIFFYNPWVIINNSVL